MPTKNDVTFAKMGAVEKKVFQNLSSSGFKYSKSDIQEIAKQCNLTVVQVEVAMQLLSHKKLIP